MNKRQLNEATRIALIGNSIGMDNSKSSPSDELHQCPKCGHEYWNHGPKYCPECKKRLWSKDDE